MTDGEPPYVRLCRLAVPMVKQQLPAIDPNAPPSDVHLLKEWRDPAFDDPRRIYLTGDGFLILQSESIYPPTGEILRSQLELPAEGAGWLADSIENRFWKKPSEGGLPVEVLHDQATIRGERIKINRGNNIGGEGVGGFRIVNLDREEGDEWHDLQEFGLTDFELVGQDLLTFLKDVASRYAAGQI